MFFTCGMPPDRFAKQRLLTSIEGVGIADDELPAQRVHGDCHLGQVLLSEGRWRYPAHLGARFFAARVNRLQPQEGTLHCGLGPVRSGASAVARLKQTAWDRMVNRLRRNQRSLIVLGVAALGVMAGWFIWTWVRPSLAASASGGAAVADDSKIKGLAEENRKLKAAVAKLDSEIQRLDGALGQWGTRQEALERRIAELESALNRALSRLTPSQRTPRNPQAAPRSSAGP